jgi:hypothetical protein
MSALTGTVFAAVLTDTTPPVTTATSGPAPNANGWNNTSVTVTLTATDDLSGVDHSEFNLDNTSWTLYSGPTAITTDGLHAFQYRSVDKAGNVETVHTLTVKIDQTPPSTSCAAPDGLWHAADVTIACTASDAGSGLAIATDANFSLTTSVAAGTETATATTNSHQVCDVAGNCTTAGPISALKVDRKPPTITFFSRTPLPNANGWNNTNVVLTWTCADAGSGPAAGSVTQTVSGEGQNRSASGTCADQVGNTASDTQTGINIDRTPPTISLKDGHGHLHCGPDSDNHLQCHGRAVRCGHHEPQWRRSSDNVPEHERARLFTAIPKLGLDGHRHR